MAAPHVAALAARYGNSATTPVEREKYIRAKLFATGFTDEAGLTIYVPSYTQAPAFTVPVRLPVSSVTADSTASGSTPANAANQVYLTDMWASGHAPPAWIEFDLGSVRTVTGVRLVPEQSPDGAVVHYVYAGTSPAPSTLIGTVSGNASILEPLSAAVGPASARYVRIYTATNPSWVSWREVEILGN